MAINWKRVRQTIILATLIAVVVLLSTGCAVTVNPGRLWIGAQPTWAANKQGPVCSVSQSQNWSNKTTSSSESWSCTEVYDLGNQRCTRSWTEYRSVYNAPGKANDSASISQSNAAPYCRPLTPAELKVKQHQQ